MKERRPLLPVSSPAFAFSPPHPLPPQRINAVQLLKAYVSTCKMETFQSVPSNNESSFSRRRRRRHLLRRRHRCGRRRRRPRHRRHRRRRRRCRRRRRRRPIGVGFCSLRFCIVIGSREAPFAPREPLGADPKKNCLNWPVPGISFSRPQRATA